MGLGSVRAGLAIIACTAAVAAGCSSRAAPPAVQPPPPSAASPDTPEPDAVPESASPDLAALPLPESACEVIPDAGEPIVSVALSDAVDPARAPDPSNESERLVFRQLYETLVRVDCDGRLRPALADTWRLGADGRTWIVRLRDEARFSDGTPVTTADVRAGWIDAARGNAWPHVIRHVESVALVDDRVLAVTLRSDSTHAPWPLAEAGLAVVRRVPGERWPLGTRGARIVADRPGVGPDGDGAIVLEGVAPDSAAAADSRSWTVRFLPARGRDLRDVLDEGVDLLVTSDAAAIRYAAARTQLTSVPLAWQRTRVLLSPWREDTLAFPAGARQTLARDAVRGEARGAEGPFWWQARSDCEVPRRQSPTRQGQTTGRIVYEEGDEASRDLAERLVGVAGTRGTDADLDALLPPPSAPGAPRAAGLTDATWASALAAGNEAAYLVSVPRSPLDACQALRALVDAAPWLDPATIVPLVDTRPRAIVRGGRSGLRLEWDGGLTLTPGQR